MLQRRTWLSRITNEREFRHREWLWLWDRISDYQYLTACYQIDQVRRSRPSSQAEIATSSTNGTRSERGMTL